MLSVTPSHVAKTPFVSTGVRTSQSPNAMGNFPLSPSIHMSLNYVQRKNALTKIDNDNYKLL